LLDTSIVIHYFKDNSIASQLDSFAEVLVPSTVVGELYFGAYRSLNPQKHIAQIQLFLQNCSLVLVDAETAILYGSIKAVLLAKGKPIPENDIWISAAAIQYNLPLFTTDKHFKEVDGLMFI
jgi:tRNA(fMet)-specific endonuclease VapC